MSAKRIWITRAEPAAAKSAKNWQSAGFETICAPLIEIAPPKIMPQSLDKNAVLLITSKNALHMLGRLTDRRDWPVMTVGDASADLARDMGFADVISAGGTGKDLIALVKNTYKPGQNIQFTYVSAETCRVQIAKRLVADGYMARRDVYYCNRPVMKFPEIDTSALTHIALYSPMAARKLSTHLAQLEHITIISMSSEVDKALGAANLAVRCVASRPEESAMIRALSS